MRTIPTIAAVFAAFSLGLCPANAQTIGAYESTIDSPNADVDSIFGTRIAVNDTYILISAIADDQFDEDAGVVFLFARDTGQFIRAFTGSDTGPDDLFGIEISLTDDNIAAISSVQPQALSTGAVYIIDLDTGTEIAKLTPPANFVDMRYGRTTATNGQLLAVDLRESGLAGQARPVYIYDIATGALERQIDPPAGDIEQFGTGLIFSGDRLFVAAGDSPVNEDRVVVFDVTTGANLGTLTPTSPASSRGFGTNMATEGDVLVITDWAESSFGGLAGAAYVFDLGTMTQVHRLIPDDINGNDRFGFSVAIEDGRIVLTSILDDDDGENTGACYIFEASSGAQLVKFRSPSPTPSSSFGNKLAVHNQRVFVTQPNAIEEGIVVGDVNVYRLTGDPCVGDCDNSGVIDFNDVVTQLFRFNAPFGPSVPCDVRDDGVVDFNDLLDTLFLFGPCP